MSLDLSIEARFHPPPEDLRRYFTTFYVTSITVPGGGVVRDALQPEWANLRFFCGARPVSWFEGQPELRDVSFTATGPSSRPCNFTLGSTRFWGVGLMPLGWDRFVHQPAAQHTNLMVDGRTHPTFTHFAPLADELFGSEADEAAEFDRIVDFFRALDRRTAIEEERIQAIHSAMVDPQIDSVARMVERTGIGQRTIERLCDRAFGFSPKMLLRRQRFMRSLAQFMLDPSLKWIGAIDSQYHDQAQFVREFHEFMGMTPREYAAQPHPVLERFMHERARIHGAPVQTMDPPSGAGPRHG